MSYKISYDPESKIVCCQHAGRITKDGLRTRSIKTIELAKANSANLYLIDVVDLEGGVSTVGLYDLPAVYEKAGVDRRVVCAAILYNAKDKALANDVHFYETVCINNGWKVKMFSDRQEAIRWLTGGN